MLDLPPLIDRRRFLQLMSAALALAEGGCARSPIEPIVPYAHQPEGLVAGVPLFFATILTQGGYAHGVLVESRMGRPTKIEGNPHHPASLGSTGPIEQGRILELWDPGRSRACLHHGQIVSWEELEPHLRAQAREWEASGGSGVRLLLGGNSSPTTRRQIAALIARFPGARVHVYEPVHRDNVLAGSVLAFGRPAEPVYRFANARVMVALDADFLGSLPGHVRYARDFAACRRPESGNMSRLYAAECSPTITGSAADRHLAVTHAELLHLARALREGVRTGNAPGAHGWVQQAVRDLRGAPGESLVLAGEAQPPAVHALACAMNQHLGNLGRTVGFIEPVCGAESNADSLAGLVGDMAAGRVTTLIVSGANPVYTTPADLDFLGALRKVPETFHHGLYVDETAARCSWHIPASHELEDWSDARAFDGTVSLQQPLIAPLYGGHSLHTLLGLLAGLPESAAHEHVRRTWGETWGTDRESRWHEALHRGVIADSEAPALEVQARDVAAPGVDSEENAAQESTPQESTPQESTPQESAPPGARAQSEARSIDLLFRPDPTVWDGRYAPIAWLQELPKPLSQLTWANAALMGASQAAALGLANEDRVALAVNGHELNVPVWIVPRHAPHSVTLHLGGGRTVAGIVGSGRGVSAYTLRPHASQWRTRAQLRRAAGTERLASVQQHHRMEGRELVRSARLEDFQRNPHFAQRAEVNAAPSLYPPRPRGEHAWAMAIDLSTCIGCNACTIACQAENNIPTVGKEEVLRGREMHWIRVDRYEEDEPSGTRTHFQPVPCMQCEHAPCELVCPVEASVHDPQGINVQVYNRCVGTRFCSNNCPYKVRRFNFLQYASDDPTLAAQRNPDVTVRMRGVMEKCNYCLQRLIRARIGADREQRPLRDGDVMTACQSVCPTRAITFGDLVDPESAVSRARVSPRNYLLLGELNTRPRTSYLAKVVNPGSDGPGAERAAAAVGDAGA